MGHRAIPATENEQSGNVSGVMKILNLTALVLTHCTMLVVTGSSDSVMSLNKVSNDKTFNYRLLKGSQIIPPVL